MQIYLYRDGQRIGPYTQEQVAAALSVGTFQPTDLAWRGADGWIPLSTLLATPYEYKCLTCGSKIPPTVLRRISTGGWVFFFALLLICLPIALFGFLMKEEYSVCPACGTQKTLN